MPNIYVKIEGTKKLTTELPLKIKEGQRGFVNEFGQALAVAITEASPKGGIRWTGRGAGENSALISSSHPGAKALDRGAFISPKGHPRLRFNVGGRDVFPKFVRLSARNYVAKGLRARNKIATALWGKWMDL